MIYELRQYTLHPGRRDELIELFDREFVESQERTGMRVLGQFRDTDDPDRFVWVRGFASMPARAAALAAFYDGPVWRAHRDAANATMIDSDDVLLLRPADPGGSFRSPAADRAPAGATVVPPALVTVTLCHFAASMPGDFPDFFADRVLPVLAGAGAAVVARLCTEYAENTFPRLPVRAGEHVFAWFARFADAARHAEHVDRLARSAEWTEEVLPELGRRLGTPPRRLTLTPTARSLLR